jgi:hypothetical protein
MLYKGHPRDQLLDVVSNGIVIDVFSAEEALFLDELIGRDAKKINEATFGAFFRSLQIILGRHLILVVNRIFEYPNPRHQLRSIPVALQILESHADNLKIEQRSLLKKKLRSVNLVQEEQEFDSLTDFELTAILTEYFRKNLPRADLTRPEGLSKALNALRKARNKQIAHHEAIESKNLPKATYAEIDQLVAYAKQFLAIIGDAYLSARYEFEDGTYRFTSDAKRAARCVKRLLVKAGVYL